MKSTKNSKTRPPIVTIMGHVDHGKTTLLDVIRSSRVAEGEHGGITQHIGAYQVKFQDQFITFIDTPGHAAFSQMRSRGAQVTDIIILVVAANDGVMPQTVESIKHIHAAKVPVIVAINKMDVPGASPDMVKAQLTEHQIFCEGFGGQTPAIPISALTKTGIDQLLEMILLVAEMEELKSDPSGDLEAVIIESNLDKHKGPLATVIVKNGTLRPQNTVYVNKTPIKIRAMLNEFGKVEPEAGPGKPIVLMGLDTVPPVGATITTHPEPLVTTPKNTVEGEEPVPTPENTFDIVLKADTLGTLEAIKNNLSAEIRLLGEGVGPITESDIEMALTTKAKIIGFNVPTSTSAKKLAKIEKVPILSFQIIYKLLEYMEKKALRLLEPTIDEEELGVANIIQTFTMHGDKIAGCKVISGSIERKNNLHLSRNDVFCKDVHIRSLKQGKNDVEIVKAGDECGVVFRQNVDFQIGDVLKSYKKIEEEEILE